MNFAAIRLLAVHDLKGMLRERETLLWLFLMPPLFFWFIGSVTGGYGGGGGDTKDRIGVHVPADAGFVADHLLARLETEGFEVVRLAEPQGLAEYTRQLALPADLTGRVQRRERSEITWRRKATSGLAPDFDKVRVQRAVYTLLADLVTLAVRDVEPGAATLTALAGEPRHLRLDVAAAGNRPHIPTGFEQAIPGTLVMFTLMILLTGGGIPLVQERRQGLLRRLASAPITRGELVLGKGVARLGLAVVQITFGMLVGTLLFGMQWGPDLPMVLVVLLAWGLLCTMLGMLLGNLARSEGQAVGLGILSSMALAALGGCWWPIEIVPQWLQHVAGSLPTGWTMAAIHQLVSFRNGAGAALPHVAAIAAATLVAGWLAARTFRYQ